MTKRKREKREKEKSEKGREKRLKEKAPTLETIKEATKHFKKVGEEENESLAPSASIAQDVQSKLETLINSIFNPRENNPQPSPSSPNPNASSSAVGEGEGGEGGEGEEEIETPQVDPASLQSLTMMGFPENACRKALILHKFLFPFFS